MIQRFFLILGLGWVLAGGGTACSPVKRELGLEPIPNESPVPGPSPEVGRPPKEPDTLPSLESPIAVSSQSSVASTPFPSPSPVPSASPPARNASLLQLRLISAGEDPAFPDPSVDPKAPRPEEEVLTETEEVILRNVILLPNPAKQARPVFLVWKEGAFHSPIITATFEHRIRDMANQITGELDRTSASFDRLTRRWFIPMKKLIPRASDVDPSDQHELVIDLILKDGSRLSFLIHFRVLGVLTPGAIVTDQIHPQRDIGILSFELRNVTGYLPVVSRISNPSTRSVSLWVRRMPLTLNLRVFLKAARYTQDCEFCPPKRGADALSMNTGMLQSPLIGVRRRDEGFRLLEVHEEWTRLSLAPQEEIAIYWGPSRVIPERSARVRSVG